MELCFEVSTGVGFRGVVNWCFSFKGSATVVLWRAIWCYLWKHHLLVWFKVSAGAIF